MSCNASIGLVTFVTHVYIFGMKMGVRCTCISAIAYNARETLKISWHFTIYLRSFWMSSCDWNTQRYKDILRKSCCNFIVSTVSSDGLAPLDATASNDDNDPPYIYIYIQIILKTHTHIYIYVCVCMCMYMYMYVYMYMYMDLYMYMYV